MKTLYLENIAGIAGDMFSASFVDAGLIDPQALKKLPELLELTGVEIAISSVTRASMRATHIDVVTHSDDWKGLFGVSHKHSHKNHDDDHWHIHFSDLREFVKRAPLSPKNKEVTLAILECLAEAEAHCHGVPKNDVAFHEVGAIDSLLDMIMAGFCLSEVAPDSVFSSPIKLGRGIISIQHGTHPVPPPGSASLAKGMPISSVPEAIKRENVELSTPTGLAILKALNPHWSNAWPSGKLVAQGVGAGTMDLGNYPNLFRVCLIDSEDGLAQGPLGSYLSDTVVEISTNLDDMTSEVLSWACEKLFTLGAIDVWQTPSVGKKGRVLITLSVLVEKPNFEKCAEFILKKTSTFGIRYRDWNRLKLERRFESRMMASHSVQIKIGENLQGEKIKEKPEFEDLRNVWEKDFETMKS